MGYGMLERRAKLAASRPPRASARHRMICSSRAVRRDQGLKMLSSKPSAKMRRRRRTASPRKRRAWSMARTRRPAIGKSAGRRWCRLWTRPETTPQDAHGLFGLVVRIRSGGIASFGLRR